jgi:hypothetical protein
MSEQSLEETGVTDTQESQAQAAKTYTQEEFDRHMAGLKSSLQKKYEKTFSELGDIDELRALKTQAEAKKLEEAKKRGEFEKVLQELAAKKDEEIQKRDAIIQDYKLNMPLLNAAAKHKAVNPQQVQTLLRNNIRLNQDGDAEVIDSTGAVRYTDQGTLFTVEQYVEEWLQQNPHFMSAAPATVNTKSMIAPGSTTKIDLKDLDLTRPQDRKIYAEARQKGLL